jgi:hypothetical protein
MANRVCVRNAQTLRFTVDSAANVNPISYVSPIPYEIIAVTLINRAAVAHTATLSNGASVVATVAPGATNGAVVPAVLIASVAPNTQNYVPAGNVLSVLSTDALARFELLVTVLPNVISST